MPDRFAHNSIWKTSDAIFSVTLILGLVLHFAFPLHLTTPIAAPFRLLAGAALVLVGVIIIALSKRDLKNAGQPSAPGKPTTRIVETGIYRFSRNPLYLGLVVVLAGLGLGLDIVWWLLFTIPLLLAFHYLLVLPEEQYLLGSFGEQYMSYRSRVRRWL